MTSSAALLSGLLLYASFPPLDWSFVAWITLVPLFVALYFARYLQAFFLTLLTGAVLAGLHTQWLMAVPGFPVLAFVLLVLYGALFFGLFGFLSLVLVRRTTWPSVLVIPTLWVAFEFLRSNVSFLSIPFFLVGFSQYANLSILQLASITSVYGVSFLIVLVNAALAEWTLWVLSHYSVPMSSKPSLSRVLSASVVAMLSILGVLLWGSQQVHKLEEATNPLLTASLIQGNIPQQEKWEPRLREKIMERYRDLTLKASQDHPDIIMWPEAATPEYLTRSPWLFRAVRDLVRETGIPLLIGSATYAKIRRDGKVISQARNTAFLLNAQGEIIAAYDKMRLLPFGEYLPLEGRLPWPRWLAPRHGNFISGTSPTVFDLPEGRFGVVICWENLFSDVFRTFVNAGAQFMVNLTNESWFDKTAASRQILSMSVFRAVENRVTLLRVANTGITCLIDPLGRIQDRVRDAKGNDQMVSGTLTVAVPAPLGPTFYTHHGNVFASACLGIVVLLLLSAALPVRIFQSLATATPQSSQEPDDEH
jgi:apolipoprotein N-acyltransferase